MGILLAFASFVAFAIVVRLVDATEGLIVGVRVSLVLIAHDMLMPRREAKILEIGTAILFAGLEAHNPGYIMG